MNKYIICPICNRQYQTIRIEHLRNHGYSSREDFLRDYPNFSFSSDYRKFINAKSAREGFTEEMRETARINGRKNFINYNKSQWKGKDGERRKAIRTEEMKKIANNSEIQRKSAISRTGVVSKTRSSSMKKRWEDDKYAMNVIKHSHQSLSQMKSYSNGNFRSSYENKLVELLNKLGLEWKYEELTFKYNYKDKLRRYTPDFYLPKYNLIIEVKPSSLVEDEFTQAKKNACIGYKYCFVTEKELRNINNLKKVIESATTIENIG